MSPEFVTRYVVTYINGDGLRTLAFAAQGRNTFSKKGEAALFLRSILAHTPPSTIEAIYGTEPRFEVRPCECWPGHFDPRGIYFHE